MKQQEELATKKDLKKLEDALTGKIDGNAEKIVTNAAKIDTNSEILGRLTSLVLENQSEIKKMVTRDEFNKRFDEVISAIDGLARSFSVLEQERVVTNKRLDRIEAKLF